MTTTRHQVITADEFATMDFEAFEGIVELVQGEIIEMVRPSAIHGAVCGEVAFQLKLWSNSNCDGYVITNDSGILTHQNPDTVRGPDLCFVSKQKLTNGELPAKWIDFAPDLCVEVLSLEDRWQDVLKKVAEFLEIGTKEVWLLDAEVKNVHIYTIDNPPMILSQNEILVSPHLENFACPVADLFPQSKQP